MSREQRTELRQLLLEGPTRDRFPLSMICRQVADSVWVRIVGKPDSTTRYMVFTIAKLALAGQLQLSPNRRWRWTQTDDRGKDVEREVVCPLHPQVRDVLRSARQWWKNHEPE